MGKKNTPNDSGLTTEKTIRLIFSKAKELCDLLGTVGLDMYITINSNDFYISQRYDKDASFVDESDNRDNSGGNRGET